MKPGFNKLGGAGGGRRGGREEGRGGGEREGGEKGKVGSEVVGFCFRDVFC